MLPLIALYLAGLSFFFSGVSGISENLRQLSGQRFRGWLAKATDHPVMAALLGALLGSMTQSTSVVAFVLSGMIATGLLPLSRALVVLAFSNIGTAVLVFIAALDMHLVILLIIGITGIVLAFKLFSSWKPGVAGLLSLGLVFLGLEMMKQAFQPLSSSAELMRVSKFFAVWPDMAFFLGMLLRSVIHSSAAVAAITITINKGNMLGEVTAMMTIAGLGAGTAVATYFLSSNLRGVPRQIALFQMLANLCASVIVASLLLIERGTGVPLLLALLNKLSPSMAGRTAFMYLILNIVIAGVSIASLRWAPALLVKISPPTPEEHLARPMYLQEEALLSPETALDLVALEQLRMIRVLPQYLEAARGQTVPLVPLHSAAGALDGEITRFLESLSRQLISSDLAARVISFQRKEETLKTLEDNIFLFAETLKDRGETLEVTGRLVEALDTLVLTAMDALHSKERPDAIMLIGLTDDRGGMMERLRERHRVDDSKNVGDVSALHYATTLFERNVWLLRQLALWMQNDTDFVAT